MLLSFIGVVLLAGLIYVLRFLWIYRDLYFGKENRDKYFVEICKDFPVFHNGKTRPMKRKLFETLHSMKSSIPEIKKKNGIRILEIGAGSGANFEFYPPNTNLVVVDPNPFFEQYLKENLDKFPNVKLERSVIAGAENMKDVADHSVDAVVSTLVLCSVPELQQVYKEIKRVLVPGGKFLFMEHVIDDKISPLMLVQKFFGLTGIFQFLFDGCRPDTDIEPLVKKVGFAKVECTRFRLDTTGVPASYWTVYVAEPHLYGIATTAS